jgi:heptosyltransferase-2
MSAASETMPDKPSQNGSILVIRGGAIGDFILTLPAIRLLREGFPNRRLEIVGYRHICALAEGRFYADATRCMEYAPMAGFFNPRSELDAGLAGYFSGFDQIVSYLFDPDGFFEGNLRRCGAKNLVLADPRVHGPLHAARHLAQPLEDLGLTLENPAAEIFPSSDDLAAAEKILGASEPPFFAFHPGSGSEKKNWPLDRWQELIRNRMDAPGTLLIVGGESDAARIACLRQGFSGAERVRFVEGAPLCALGAIFSRCALFVGHDSGISHLAAAAGARCLLLFGPTNPGIWAPQNPGVDILAAENAELKNLAVSEVLDRIERCSR